MFSHGYKVNSFGMVELWCVKHRESFLCILGTYEDGSVYMDGECCTCSIEASYGCSMDDIGYCDEHGMNVGPNKICCDNAMKRIG